MLDKMIEIYIEEGNEECNELVTFLNIQQEKYIVYKVGDDFNMDRFKNSGIRNLPIIRWNRALYGYGHFRICFNRLHYTNAELKDLVE